MSTRTLPENKTLDYAIALARAIEYHCRGEEVSAEIAAECPHHARMLNDHRAEALQALGRLEARTAVLCMCMGTAFNMPEGDPACRQCRGEGAVFAEGAK